MEPKALPPAKINSSKLLGTSRLSSAVKKISAKSLDSRGGESGQDILVIKKQVIQVSDLIKSNILLKQQQENRKRKEAEKEKFVKKEEKLEERKEPGQDKLKLPPTPKLGFLERIKNFLFNIILGKIAIALLPNLPKLSGVFSAVFAIQNTIIDYGGKILNGLMTFVDKGYEVYDQSKKLIKNFGGEPLLKLFDGLTGSMSKVIDAAIIAAIAFGSLGGDDFGGPGGERPGTGGRPKVTTSGGGRAGGIGLRSPFRQRPKVTVGRGSNRALLSSVRPFLKRIPIPVIGALIDFGLSWALGEDPGRAAFKAIGAGLLGSLGAALGGGIGLAGGPLAIAGAALGGLAGGTLGDMAGGAIYDIFFGKKSPQSPKVQGRAQGGQVTRGGKAQTGAKREIGGLKKKGQYKRLIAKKPGEVEIDSPGAAVGGEKKIFGIFPKPSQPQFASPFDVIRKTGKELGKGDFFGPILAISSKITAGQLPTEKDYQNVGLGINLLISKGLQEQQLKGGVVAAFAEGGLVDSDVLSAVETGSDISNWVAKTFKGEVETNAQKTLRMIRENAAKKKEGDGALKSTTEEDLPMGTGSLVGNTNAEKVFNFLIGSGFTEQAAAGVIGNLMQESGVNPQSRQLGGGPGRGIMQWGTGPGSGGRWDALSAWAASAGKDPWTLDTQVEWMMKEMRSYGTYTRLKGVTNVKQAVEIFEREMEKAGTPNYPRRYQFAADALASFGKGKAGGVGVDKGGLGGSVIEYITGDPNTPVGRYDLAGHGLTSNYHDHLAFRTVADKERAKKLLISSGIKIGSEYRPGDPGYHGKNLAFDVPGYQWGGRGSIGQKEFSGSKRVREVLGLAKFAKGGKVHGFTRAILGEKGPEFVIDADSTRALEENYPGFLNSLNKADYGGAIKVLRNYASYESGAATQVIIDKEIIPILFPVPTSQPSAPVIINQGTGEDYMAYSYKQG